MVEIKNLASIGDAAKKFIQHTGSGTVFAFRGKMGAGKTTFIKAICEELGVLETVNSPSFAIINEYQSEAKEETIYHFDFYRINSIREAINIGAEDYFNSGSLCFIEWPENVAPLLPDNTVWVDIKEHNDGSRVVRISEDCSFRSE
jgi:tRNA threonylcarbamoyladenosine biosynthesis protein TsaE